jgi:hypothetical protein
MAYSKHDPRSRAWLTARNQIVPRLQRIPILRSLIRLLVFRFGPSVLRALADERDLAPSDFTVGQMRRAVGKLIDRVLEISLDCDDVTVEFYGFALNRAPEFAS